MKRPPHAVGERVAAVAPVGSAEALARRELRNGVV
jgi:hypothetical protein